VRLMSLKLRVKHRRAERGKPSKDRMGAQPG
jgi:hypothetical protein